MSRILILKLIFLAKAGLLILGFLAVVPACAQQDQQGLQKEIKPGDKPSVDSKVAGSADASSQTYSIGEQDVLTITVWREPELSGSVVVRPDGMITLPLVNELRVVGMTPAELQTLLTEKLKPFVSVPQVTVSVREINSRKVYVIGQVGHEGSYRINSSTTVLQIIAEAGGLRDFANRKKIYVLRKENGKEVRFPFNYDDVVRGKSPKQDIVLNPGDTVVVP